MSPAEFNGAFPTREELQMPIEGEGISRPTKGTKTKKYRLSVRQRTIPIMKVVLQAETPKDALRYAHARWPESAIELIK